jgi:hypothetical protein
VTEPTPGPPNPAVTGVTTWRPADLSGLTERLAAARSLLEQAAALAVAEDTARVTNMTHLQEQLGKERDAHNDGRRKYR